jgi:hydroxyacylglutathione hydrolase
LTKLSELPSSTHVYCAHEYTLANLRFAKAVEPDNLAISAKIEHVKPLREKKMPTLPSTILAERATNPFLRCNEQNVRLAAEKQAGGKLLDDIAVFAALRQWKDSF